MVLGEYFFYAQFLHHHGGQIGERNKGVFLKTPSNIPGLVMYLYIIFNPYLSKSVLLCGCLKQA
jgi:hypothetical protein